MADLTPDQAIDKLRSLPEDKQRAVLMQLSPEERKGILGRLTGAPGPKVNTTPAKPSGPAADIAGEQQRYQASGPVQRGISSFESNFGIPQSVQEHPSVAAQGLKMAMLHPGLEMESLKEMYNGMSKAQQDLIDRAYFLQHQPGLANKANGFVLGIYSAIPIAGPAIVNALDQWKAGDKAGAIGSLTALGSQLYRPGEARVAEAGTGGEMARPGVAKPPATPDSFLHRTARHLTEADTATRQAVKKGIETRTEDLAKNREARQDTIKSNIEKEHAARTAIDREKIQVAEENVGIEQENKAQAEQVVRRGQLAKQVDTESASLGKDISSLESKVYQEANHKFNVVRAKIGNPEAPPDDLLSAVSEAQEDILQGIPEKVKEFNAIIKMEGAGEEVQALRSQIMETQGFKGKYENLSESQKNRVDFAVAQEHGGIPEANQPVTWDKLQRLKTVIDSKMRSRSVDPVMKRALGSVRDHIVNDYMTQMAENAGAGPEWEEARQFYREWREDFHEPTGPSGSGSPVAQARDAVDPSKIRQPFARTQSEIGNRGLDTLRKYQQFGGDKVAERAQRILDSHREMEGLPETAKPKPLKKANQVNQLPTRKPAPAIPEKPTIDLKQVARDRILQTAQRVGRLNAWDARIIASSVVAGVLAPFLGVRGGVELGAGYVAMKYFLSNALEKPKVLDWIARTPAREIESLNQLPGIDKINVQHGLTEAVAEAGKGKTIKVSPELRIFLGPMNVNHLVDTGAITGSRERRPADQIRDLHNMTSNPALPAGEEQ